MSRLPHSLALATLVVFIGCGKSEPVAENDPPNSQGPSSTQASPAEIVSQFLDRVRRGGEHSGAGELLTTKARSELARIGRSVKPLGSPDASFQVTRSEPVPGKKDARLVQSIWSEPNPDGSESSYEVVWAVQQEAAGWRISGLAMRMNQGDPPMVVNFEDGDLMAQVLAEEDPSGNQSQAAAPQQSTRK